MPTIYRTRSGLLLYETFDGPLGPGWRVEPEGEAGRVSTSLRAGHLRLQHGSTRLFVLRALPPDPDLVVEAEVDYDPEDPAELGGLIVFAAEPDEWAGIVERLDPSSPTSGWRFLRLVRSGGVRWDAYASHDGVAWDWLGAQRFPEAAEFGVVLDGSAGDTLDVDTLRVYRSTRITVQAVQPGWTVQLVASDGTTVLEEAVVPSGQTRVELDVGDRRCPITGYIRAYDGAAVVRDSGLLQDIWGGDEYRAEVMVAVYDDLGNPVPLDREWDFGEVPGGGRERRLELRNGTGIDLTNVAVAVVPHPGGDFGDAWVDVAADTGGVPGTYGDVATVASIPAGGSGYVWVRVTRGLDGPPLDRYRFGLRITIP